MGEVSLRSVSQVNQYLRCPQSYKLARVDGVWQRPAAWLPQGTAVHAVAEACEMGEVSLEDAEELFREVYKAEVEVLTEVTPNFGFWFHSGPYTGERDVERRFHIGLEQVRKFVEWRSQEGQEVWVCPDGRRAVELPFTFDLEPITGHSDGIRVRGFIDAVVVLEDGSLRVRDYKTGNSPGDDFQLGVYALAVELTYSVRPASGDYFMAGKSGKPARLTAPYDLSGWTREEVSRRFWEVEEGIRAERFDPLPEPGKCRFCDVSLSCPVFSG